MRQPGGPRDQDLEEAVSVPDVDGVNPDRFAKDGTPHHRGLAFCDANSSEGIDELRSIVSAIWTNGDHLVARELFVRTEGSSSRLV